MDIFELIQTDEGFNNTNAKASILKILTHSPIPEPQLNMIEFILNSNKANCFKACDLFNYGFICGKKAERKRKLKK